MKKVDIQDRGRSGSRIAGNPACEMTGWLTTICAAAMFYAAACAQGVPPAQPNQPPSPGQASADPSADPESARHGVARLSLMNGGVSIAHGNAGEMAGAVTNAPLVTEDRVITAGNGRAEVQFDAFNVIRLAPSSEVRMGDLRYKRLSGADRAGAGDVPRAARQRIASGDQHAHGFRASAEAGEFTASP